MKEEVPGWGATLRFTLKFGQSDLMGRIQASGLSDGTLILSTVHCFNKKKKTTTKKKKKNHKPPQEQYTIFSA